MLAKQIKVTPGGGRAGERPRPAGGKQAPYLFEHFSLSSWIHEPIALSRAEAKAKGAYVNADLAAATGLLRGAPPPIVFLCVKVSLGVVVCFSFLLVFLIHRDFKYF